MMLASTGGTQTLLRLPAGDLTNSSLYLVAHIRDTLNCVTELQMGSVTVHQERAEIYALIEGLYESLSGETNVNDTEEIRQRLFDPDLNTQGQTFISYSRLMNDIDDELVQTAVQSISPTCRHLLFQLFFSRWSQSHRYLHITLGHSPRKCCNVKSFYLSTTL